MQIIRILALGLIALATWPHLAIAQSLGPECIDRNRYYPGHQTTLAPERNYEADVKAAGRDKANAMVVWSMKRLNLCALNPRVDPVGWSEERLLALSILDSVLQITAIRAYFPDSCRSVLSAGQCSMIFVDYDLFNATDDFSFNSVGVSCRATLPGTKIDAWQYDPVVGSRLGPREHRTFSGWFPLAFRGPENFQASDVADCHIIAAAAVE